MSSVSHGCAPTVSAMSMVLSLTFALLLLAAEAGSPPNPSWSTNCDHPFNRCARVETFEDWATEKGKISFYLRARFADMDGGITAWYVGDHFGKAFEELKDAGINIVHVQPRGGGMASPQLSCDRSELDRFCQPTSQCARKLKNVGSASTFSIEQAARDLHWVLRSLTGNAKSVVIGEGFGSAVAMRYMANTANNSVAVMLVNPVHPIDYDYFNGAWQGYDLAMQALLSLCDSDTTCSAQLGATEGAWYRMLNILSAAGAGHLPCESRLNWGKKAAFETALREQLAAMLLPPSALFEPASATLASLIPAFLYRLQRCNDGDVKSLQTLRSQTLNAKLDSCPGEAPLRYFWLANEFTPEAYKSGTGVPSARSLISNGRAARVIFPVEAVISTFSEFYEAVPKYTRKETDHRVLFTRSKVLLVMSNLDPLLPVGLANKLALTYTDGNTASRHPRAGALHLAGSTGLYSCIHANLKQFKVDEQWGASSACSAVSSTATGGIDFVNPSASLFFGVESAWSFTQANDAEPPGGRHKPGKERTGFLLFLKRIFQALLWLAAIAALGALGFYAYNYFKGRFVNSPFSDNFYDNLHR